MNAVTYRPGVQTDGKFYRGCLLISMTTVWRGPRRTTESAAWKDAEYRLKLKTKITRFIGENAPDRSVADRLDALEEDLRTTGKLVSATVCSDAVAEIRRLKAELGTILNAMEDHYDGCPDSTTLWMGELIDRAKKLL